MQRVNPIRPFAVWKLESLLAAGYRVVFALLETEDIRTVLSIGLQSPHNCARGHNRCKDGKRQYFDKGSHVFFAIVRSAAA